MAPKAAPSLVASGDNTSSNLCALPKDLPPEITTFAELSAGLSDALRVSLSQRVLVKGKGASIVEISVLASVFLTSLFLATIKLLPCTVSI